MSLSKYDEIPYIYQLNLKNFIKTEVGFRCSCPICKEGRHPNKRRCNILTNKHEHITVFCFNCGANTNLKTFIQMVDPLLYDEYNKKEKEEYIKNCKEGTLHQKINDIKSVLNINTPLKYQFKLNTKYFKEAKNSKKAIEFCKNRCIIEYIDNFYYSIHPKSALTGMIIFPFYLEDNITCYGLQGRHTEYKTFHTMSLNENFKVYGIFDVDRAKPIIAVESLIDSLNINNAISMLGADLSTLVQKKLEKCDVIYAFDQDSTGLDKSIKYCNNRKKVFVWPDNVKEKDFNKLSQNGWTNSTITNMILENSYTDLELHTKLAFKSLKKR